MQPITLTNKDKEKAIEILKEKLTKTEFGDSSVNFCLSFNDFIDNTNIIRPKIYISSAAYIKMMLYVRDTATEIAWHGIVERYPEKHAYYIKDVFLYPQKLASATVQTDQEKYNKWMEELDDETYNHLRFQGHSHVNFGVTPSGTDLKYYNDILSVLPKNDYYIFMILNKTGDTTFLICDLEKNLIYNTDDIDVFILTQGENDTIKHIKEDKDKYCEKPSYTFYKNKYGKLYNDFDAEDYYQSRFDEELNRDTPDVNNLIDDINKKYNKFKNPKLSLGKNNKKK